MEAASTPDDDLDGARRRLLEQAALFEEPAAYAAGVEDAIAALEALALHRAPRTRPRRPAPVHPTHPGHRVAR